MTRVANQHVYETEDVVKDYLDLRSEIDGPTSPLLNDRCTMGLLAAIRWAVSSDDHSLRVSRSADLQRRP